MAVLLYIHIFGKENKKKKKTYGSGNKTVQKKYESMQNKSDDSITINVNGYYYCCAARMLHTTILLSPRREWYRSKARKPPPFPWNGNPETVSTTL